MATEYKEKVLRSTTVVVTPAQIKALVATDVTLVEAPGAGKVIELVSALLTLDFNSIAYTWANADHDITITGGGDAAIGSDAAAQALIEASARLTKLVHPAVTSGTLVENTALKLTASGTGEPAAGDSNLIVEVKYYVSDVTGDND